MIVDRYTYDHLVRMEVIMNRLELSTGMWTARESVTKCHGQLMLVISKSEQVKP